MPFSFNGIGTTYYGKRDVQVDNSFITTEWIGSIPSILHQSSRPVATTATPQTSN